MTTLTAADTVATPRVSEHHLSFPRVLRSEAIKLSTLRSTWWSIAIVAVLSTGVSIFIAATMAMLDQVGSTISPVYIALMPMQFAMLLAGILGAISVTGEYSTGMIRATLTAVPSRGAVLVARAIVVAVLVGVSSLVFFTASTLVTAPILSAGIDWSDPQAAVVPLLTGAAAMALFALIGVGLGFVIRAGGGAIAATIGLLFILPIVTTLVESLTRAEWMRPLNEILPSNAIQGILFPNPGSVDAPVLWVALVGWALGALLAGYALLRSRDA